MYLGVGGSSEIVLFAAGGRAVDSHVVCAALSVCFHLPVDDIVRLYDEPRIADAGVCFHFGDPAVHFRGILAERSDPAVLESGWVFVPFYSGNTRFYPDQYGRCEPE